jgi:hypothetical protein
MTRLRSRSASSFVASAREKTRRKFPIAVIAIDPVQLFCDDHDGEGGITSRLSARCNCSTPFLQKAPFLARARFTKTGGRQLRQCQRMQIERRCRVRAFRAFGATYVSTREIVGLPSVADAGGAYRQTAAHPEASRHKRRPKSG